MPYPHLYEFIKTHCDANVETRLEENKMHIDIHLEISLPDWITEWFGNSSKVTT